MPKIDWFDDDQPRWEPRFRVGRERRRLWPALRDRRSAADQNGSQLIVPALPTPSGRRPLHQIWGEPRRATDPSGD